MRTRATHRKITTKYSPSDHGNFLVEIIARREKQLRGQTYRTSGSAATGDYYGTADLPDARF